MKLSFRKENIGPLIVSVAIAAVYFWGLYYFGSRFTEVIWIFDLVLLGILLSVFIFIAGFAVLKSLAAVGAEISLLLYLAQSYCDVPSRVAANDEALKSLLVLSLIFIAAAFFRSLYKAVKENYKVIEKKQWSKEKIGVAALFLIFTGSFVWQIYLVIYPIIATLCVYK